MADVERLLAANDWNDDLDGAVMDCIYHRIGDEYNRSFEIVSALPPELQMVYSTWWLESEMVNGGFHQYFYNQGRFAFMAIEGCRLIGAHDHVSLLLQAVDIYLKEEPTQRLFRPSTLEQIFEQYVIAKKFSDLPSLDRAYYSLPDLTAIRVEHMRKHPDEFVIPPG